MDAGRVVEVVNVHAVARDGATLDAHLAARCASVTISASASSTGALAVRANLDLLEGQTRIGFVPDGLVVSVNESAPDRGRFQSESMTGTTDGVDVVTRGCNLDWWESPP